MEQSAPNNKPVNPKPNRLTVLAFLEVGLFEIVFVSVMVLLIFGTLNYFNILYVSETFPNILGWLPSLRVQHAYRDKINSNIYNDFIKSYYAPRPTPTPFVRFSYDTVKAQNALESYIKDNIKQEFLPEEIEVKQGLTMDGRINQNMRYEFGTYFVTEKVTLSANFIYNENTNIASDYGVFIQPNDLTSITPTESLSNSLLNIYFQHPYSVSSCQTKGTTSYCENFQVLNGEKIGYGYGTITNTQTNKSTPIVFACLVPKESKYYDILKSCIAPQ